MPLPGHPWTSDSVLAGGFAAHRRGAQGREDRQVPTDGSRDGDVEKRRRNADILLWYLLKMANL